MKSNKTTKRIFKNKEFSLFLLLVAWIIFTHKIYILLVMRNLLLIILVLFTQVLFSQQGGLHIQWHKDASGQFVRSANDTIYLPVKIANTSTYNAIATINLNTEGWSYITNNSVFTFSSAINPKVFMKNANEGVCTEGGYARYVTTDRWESSSMLTPSVTLLETTSFGYLGYTSSSGTYTAVFSADAYSWTGLYTTTLVPQFSKTSNKVFTCHNGALKVSTNGGATFSVLNPTVALVGSHIYSPNNDTLFIFSSQWLQSFDGGINWVNVALPSTSISQVACKNGKEIMLLDNFSLIKKTHYSNNSGTSWTTYTTVNTFYSGEKLEVNGSKFYLLPGYRSTDGNLWDNFLASAPAPFPYDITHTNDLVLAGFKQGYFGYSTNKGYNFTFLPNKISSSEDIMSVKAIDINTFIAADRKGQIYVSTNQGATWSQKTTSTINTIPRKICFSQDKSTIVVTSVGSAYMSGNGGSTFTWLNTTVGSGHYQSIKPTLNKIVDVAPLYTAPSFTLSGFEFYDINSSNIRTLTGSVSVSVAQDIVDVHMINDNVGYLLTRNTVSNETIVYKTTNGWVSTNTISVVSSPSVGIRAYDSKYGFLQNFGSDTLILSGSGNPINNQTNYYHVSYNAGLTWEVKSTNFSTPASNLGNRVYKMEFFTPSQFISLVSNTQCGSIQSSAGVFIGTTNLVAESVAINEHYKAAENTEIVFFPNPACEILNIKLSLASEPARLFIFNTLGQVVLSQSVSSQTEVLNIQHLKSGIYFIKICQNNKCITEKFIKN